MKLFILFTFAKFTFQQKQPDLDDFSDINRNFQKRVELAKLDIKNNLPDQLDQGLTYKFSHGSPYDVEKYLWNALLSTCEGGLRKGRNCICPSTYEETNIIQDTEKGSFAIVTVNKDFKQIVVSYRATTVFKNWETNFDMELVDADFIDGAKVHRGYLEYYQTLRPGTHAAVIKLLDQPRYANYTLHIAGLSLGAVISTISAIDWVNLLRKRNDDRKIEIYAYSGARVGDQAFVDSLGSLNVPVTRFTSSNDVVPHVPPRVWGYVHAGTELYYDPDMNRVRVCRQDVYEDSTCSQRHTTFSQVPHREPYEKLLTTPPVCQQN